MSEIRSGGYDGNNNNLITPRDFGTTCLNDFLTEIADEITGACMLPVNLPQKEVINIINRAKKWMYKKYEDSVRENYCHIPFEVDRKSVV